MSRLHVLVLSLLTAVLAAADAPQAPPSPTAGATPAAAAPAPAPAPVAPAAAAPAAAAPAPLPVFTLSVLSSRINQSHPVPAAPPADPSKPLPRVWNAAPSPGIQLEVSFPVPEGWIILAAEKANVVTATTDTGEDITLKVGQGAAPPMRQFGNRLTGPFSRGALAVAEVAPSCTFNLALPAKASTRIAKLQAGADLIIASLSACRHIVLPLVAGTAAAVEDVPGVEASFTLGADGSIQVQYNAGADALVRTIAYLDAQNQPIKPTSMGMRRSATGHGLQQVLKFEDPVASVALDCVIGIRSVTVQLSIKDFPLCGGGADSDWAAHAVDAVVENPAPDQAAWAAALPGFPGMFALRGPGTQGAKPAATPAQSAAHSSF